ncbi:MAG: helix-turn-helix domain-containing protein [Lysobacteraceae bacterium]
MAYKTRTSSVIDDAKQIDALATSIRFEIVSALEAMDDAATVAELADALGRPADGLYYHLRALVRAGVLHEQIDAGVRRYRSTVPAGQRSRLGYKPGATKNAKAVERTATSMSRLSQRDFANAIARSDSVVAGPLRELWAARVRAWVGDEELTELNRLLNEIVQLLHRPRSKDADKLIALHWIVAPIDAKPARRANAATKK